MAEVIGMVKRNISGAERRLGSVVGQAGFVDEESAGKGVRGKGRR